MFRQDLCNEEDCTCTIEDDINLLLRIVRKNRLVLRQLHHISFLKRDNAAIKKSIFKFVWFYYFLSELAWRFYLYDILGEHGEYGLGQVMTQNYAIRVLGYFQRQIHTWSEDREF